MRNRAETLAYLRMLAGERADGRYIEIRSRPAGQPWMRRTAIPAGELDRAATLITRLAADRDVFVGVALRTRPDAGGKDAIDRCHLAFVEIDTADGARRLEEFRYPPTARVGSGTDEARSRLLAADPSGRPGCRPVSGGLAGGEQRRLASRTRSRRVSRLESHGLESIVGLCLDWELSCALTLALNRTLTQLSLIRRLPSCGRNSSD